jgi:hypothetical protein
MTREEWTSALKLSTMWDFFDIRKQAIESISKLDLESAEKLCLGKEHGVTIWLKEGYGALIRKREAITNEELENLGRLLLGWETVARILRLRDHFAQSSRRCKGCSGLRAISSQCSHCGDYSFNEPDLDYDGEIRREFHSDFLGQGGGGDDSAREESTPPVMFVEYMPQYDDDDDSAREGSMPVPQVGMTGTDIVYFRVNDNLRVGSKHGPWP